MRNEMNWGKVALSVAATALVTAFGLWGQNAMAQAADVTFSQSSGVYDQAFDLKLDIAPAEGEDVTGAAIYYTTDGSNPTNSATRILYEAPVSVVDRAADANVLAAKDPALFDCANATWNSATKTFGSSIKAPSNENVDKATVIKASVQTADGNWSTTITNTYFVGEIADHIKGIKESCEAAGMKLSIASISMDEADLFDSTKGIYVKGDIFTNSLAEYLANGGTVSNNSWNDNYYVNVARKAIDSNFKHKGRDWERPAHLDYFESDGTNAGTECMLSKNCGVRVQGNYSRSDLQKSLRLYAREEYSEDGKKNFGYPFFGDDALDDSGKQIKKYKKITFRNGGNCAFNAKYNDAYWQSLFKGLKCETQASRASIVYLNGEYWGIYVMQEDFDDNYYEITHGVTKDNIVVYKGDAEKEGLGYEIDEGEDLLPEGEDDSYFFKDMLAFFDTHANLVNDADYEEFTKMVDVESFRDYFAAEIWMNNKWDWPGKNWALWKSTVVDPENPYADGKWRFNFYDMDFGGVSGESDIKTNTMKDDNYKPYGMLDMDTDNPVVKAFAYLMSNKGFRTDFENKLTELSTTNAEKTNALAVLKKYKNTYAPLYNQFIARYNCKGSSNYGDPVYGDYASYTCIQTFVSSRADTIASIVKWTEKTAVSLYGDPDATSTPSPEPTAAPTQTPVIVPPVPSPTAAPAQDDNEGSGSTTVNVKKKVSLKVSAKKGAKKIVITTTKKAKIVVTINRKIMKDGKKTVKKITRSAAKNKTGKVTISLKSKLKKSDKVKVKATKSGLSSATWSGIK